MDQRRVYRLYRQENLLVRTKTRRKRVARIRVPLARAERPNQRWSMDFMSDRLMDGRAFRVLTIVDQFSRECPLLGAVIDRQAGGGMSGPAGLAAGQAGEHHCGQWQ